MITCIHCGQHLSRLEQRCNRCDWSPLDAMGQTVMLTPTQLQQRTRPITISMAIIATGGILLIPVIGPTPLLLRGLVLVGYLLGVLLIHWMIQNGVRDEIRRDTIRRDPLPLMRHGIDRTGDGTRYLVQFGDDLRARISREQHAPLEQGQLYWVTYGQHSQRIWAIEPYVPTTTRP